MYVLGTSRRVEPRRVVKRKELRASVDWRSSRRNPRTVLPVLWTSNGNVAGPGAARTWLGGLSSAVSPVVGTTGAVTVAVRVRTRVGLTRV